MWYKYGLLPAFAPRSFSEKIKGHFGSKTEFQMSVYSFIKYLLSSYSELDPVLRV